MVNFRTGYGLGNAAGTSPVAVLARYVDFDQVAACRAAWRRKHQHMLDQKWSSHMLSFGGAEVLAAYANGPAFARWALSIFFPETYGVSVEEEAAQAEEVAE